MSSDLFPWTDEERREAEHRERAVQGRMGVCVHSRGTVIYDEPGYEANNICRAGIDIRSVMIDGHEPVQMPAIASGVPGLRLTWSFPCNDRLNACGATCTMRQPHSREEAIAWVKKGYDRLEKD